LAMAVTKVHHDICLTHMRESLLATHMDIQLRQRCLL
jgi:hypothetical protein